VGGFTTNSNLIGKIVEKIWAALVGPNLAFFYLEQIEKGKSLMFIAANT
jgi:hypothetical protein